MKARELSLLSDDNIKRIVQVGGDQAKVWIGNYPTILKQCINKWHLDFLEKLEGGYGVNQVFIAKNESAKPVVLKVGIPHSDLIAEMNTLGYYQGRGSVELLDSDESLGAMLLEKIDPGDMLKGSGSNRQETVIAAKLMRDLPRIADRDYQLPHFGDWISSAFSTFRTSNPDVSPNFYLWVDRAEAFYHQLSSTDDPDRLLHGDLHHENILYDKSRGWVVIDPKGVIGKSILETGRYLQNFFKDDDALSMSDQIAERVDIISQMVQRDRQDVFKAGMVDLILSTCWSIESGETDISRKLEIARIYLNHLGTSAT